MSMLAGLGAYATGKPIIDATAGYVANAIDVFMLDTKYESASKWPQVLPSPADLMEAWLTGNIDNRSFEAFMKYNGIKVDGPTNNNFIKNAKFAWTTVINAKLPRLTFAELVYLYYSGQITKAKWDELKVHYKYDSKFQKEFMQLMQPKFDLGIITNNFFRGFTDQADTLQAIRKMYGCSGFDATKIMEGFQYIAPPSDLLRFVVKDVFDDAQIQALGLADEYDSVASAIPWANALGIPKLTKIKYNGQEYSLDMLRAYWISHWQLMSPTQGYHALHRLRPNRLDRYNQAIPDLKPFEFTQLNALLKSNDYVPEQRKWLAASSYNLLGRIDLRRVFNADLIDEVELNERYQDAGYAKVDADLLTQYSVDEKEKKKEDDEEKKAKKAFTKKIQEVYLAYEIGAIGRDTAFNSLRIMKVDEDEANGNLDAIDLRINRKRIQEYIRMVKSEMFLGLYTGEEAYSELTFGGVEGYRASQYVIRWQRELSRPRRVASTNTILSWVRDGIMNFADASSRLSKLGYSNADTLLYLESAKMDIDHKIQMEQIAQQRTEKQRIREVQQMFRRLQADKKAKQAQLRTYSSLPTMKRWYINDEIDWPTVFERMQFLEIPLADINRYKEEWDNEKAS